MFKNDYKNQMDSVKPDGYIKDKIRRRLAEGNNAAPKKSRKGFAVSAAAAILCGALLFSAGVITGRHSVNIPTAAPENSLSIKTAQSYDAIYNTVKSFEPSFWEKIYNGFSGESVIQEENYAAPGGTDSGITEDSETLATGGYSETTVQVEGVDEADIVKTDGKYIYVLSSSVDGETVSIVDVTGKNPVKLSGITADGIYGSDMYLSGGRLIIIGLSEDRSDTAAVIYDVSDPAAPKEIQRCRQSGFYSESRLISGKLYLISNFMVNTAEIIKNDAKTFVPSLECGNYNGAVAADSVCFYSNCERPEYTVVSGYDIKDGSLTGTQSVLGGSCTVYASTDNIIACGYAADGKTQVARFAVADGEIELKATGELEGTLLNQFSVDEYKGCFRFVLTDYIFSGTAETFDGSAVSSSASQTAPSTTNSLVILDGNLKETGKIENLAPGEQVYSVRFMGDTAYFVTFRQVDPLFSADLSDPTSPKIIGSLKIPGFSNYLFPYGDGRLLGIGQNADESTGATGSIKLSMFDINNPAEVSETAKKDVPATYSEALYNHKATLADSGKNIIAFPAYGEVGINYFIYSFENGEFTEKLRVTLDIQGESCRGLYIDDIFYIVTPYEIQYFELDGFEPIGSLSLK